MKARDSLGRFSRVNNKWSLDAFDEGYINNKGRFMVFLPDHPRAYNEGYLLRSIVAYELYHNTRVPKGFIIHHKDSNTLNDSEENLEMLTKRQHRKAHIQLRRAHIKRECKHCGNIFKIERWRLKEPSRGQFCSQLCFHNFRALQSVKLDCSCPTCNKHFSILQGEYRKRLKKSKSGKIFCSKKCAPLPPLHLKKVDAGGIQ